jgi:hypothetical protein
MPSRRTSHAAGLTWLVTIAVAAAACGTGSAAPLSSATATRSASPSAASSAAGDPVADLRIASPYTLEALDAGKAAQIEQVKTGLGDVAAFVQVGARTVRKSGTSAGLLLGIGLPGVPPVSVLESMVTSAVGKVGGTMTTRTILGQEVRMVEGTTTSVAGYAHEATIFLAYGRTMSEAIDALTAVIQANE